MRKISIIGVGRLGGALAIALSKKGFQIENLVLRKKKNLQKTIGFIEPKPKILFAEDLPEISSDAIFITTQDAEIETAAKILAGNLKGKPFVFHTSGSLSSEILKDLKKIGCKTGSIHPLVSISDSVLGAEHFKGAYFCVEGEAEAVKAAKKMVKKLGGKVFFIETKYKTLYHASAVTACGHLVALVDVAVEMLTKCGLNEEEAQKILLPLIQSAVENLNFQFPAEALTGTFARADEETFEKHLEILRRAVSFDALEVYLQLGMRSAHLAEKRGAADKKKLERLRDKISLAKKNF